jgi:non-homologous end joining protein Ku
VECQEIKAARRHHGAQAKVVDIFAALKKSFETAERPAADMPYA